MPVRDARPADADAIAGIHVVAWQHAYRGQLPDDFLQALSVSERRLQWRRRMDEPPPREHVLVSEDTNGDVVGFAIVGPTRDPDTGPGTGELMAINLHPSVWRRGHGRDLIDEGLRRLRSDGYAEATLWVLESNERARRFYEALGWKPDGAAKVEERSGVRFPEVRYRVGLGGDLDQPEPHRG